MHTGIPPNFGMHAKGRACPPLKNGQKEDTHGSDRVENCRVIVLGIEHATRNKDTLMRATLTRIRTDNLALAMSRQSARTIG